MMTLPPRMMMMIPPMVTIVIDRNELFALAKAVDLPLHHPQTWKEGRYHNWGQIHKNRTPCWLKTDDVRLIA